MAVEREPAAEVRPPNPRDDIGRGHPVDPAAVLDAGRGVEHDLDCFDRGGSVARWIGAVDAQSFRQRLTTAGMRGSMCAARRPFTAPALKAVRASRAHSPDETVESVVDRTKTPHVSAVMVSTSSRWMLTMECQGSSSFPSCGH